MEWMDLLSSSAFWVAVLRLATPLILGTLGVLLCERAGVLNLGIEGHHGRRRLHRLAGGLRARRCMSACWRRRWPAPCSACCMPC